MCLLAVKIFLRKGLLSRKSGVGGVESMITCVIRRTEDGKRYRSYHISGRCPYEYFFPDVSDNRKYAAMLDRIFSRDCIPQRFANAFAACFVEFAAGLEAERARSSPDKRQEKIK